MLDANNELNSAREITWVRMFISSRVILEPRRRRRQLNLLGFSQLYHIGTKTQRSSGDTDTRTSMKAPGLWSVRVT